jgi:hypothetical protein
MYNCYILEEKHLGKFSDVNLVKKAAEQTMKKFNV